MLTLFCPWWLSRLLANGTSSFGSMDDGPGSELNNLDLPPAMSRHLPVAEPDREEGVVVSRPRVGRQAPGFLRDRTAETEKGGSLCHCGAQLRLQGLKPSLRSTGCIEKQLPSGNVRHVDDPPSPRLLGRPRRPSRQDQIANPLDRLQVRVKNAPSTTGESHA